ncbi:MAG: hypothetical protein ABSB67_04740 [Bryobacteraceae bacterium]
MIEKDGWVLRRTRGDHWQLVHSADRRSYRVPHRRNAPRWRACSGTYDRHRIC